jgi:hypothetical protein
MIKIPFKIILSCLVFLAIACKKQSVPIPPTLVKFNQTTGSYFIQNSSTSSFKIPVGVTTVSNSDRTITYTVSSPSGATAGTQYVALPGSIKIPAGQTVDSIEVKGLFTGYPTGRRDTLLLKITGGDVPAATYNSTYTLIMQKYCSVNLNNFLGDYTQSFDIDNTGTYGPYTSKITAVTPLTATTGKITISNFSSAEISPYPISDITVNLDWTDPANFLVTIPTQVISNSDFYGYGPLSVVANGASTFSSCDNSFTLNYKLTVSAGSFGNFRTIMRR